MIVMRETLNVKQTQVRPGNLSVGGAGGPAFKLQKPPQMRVPRPSRRRKRACTTTAYTTGGVERTRVAPATSPPTLANKTQGRGTLRRDDAMQRWATCQIDRFFGLQSLMSDCLSRSRVWLHSFTHGGAYQLARRYSGSDLADNYFDVDKLKALSLSADSVFMVNNITSRFLQFDAEWKRTTDLYVECSTFMEPQINIAKQNP